MQELKTASYEILKTAQLTELEADPNKFCNKNMLLRYVEANPNSFDNTRAMSYEDIEASANSTLDQKSSGGFVSIPILNDKQGVATAGILYDKDSNFWSTKKKSFSEVLAGAEMIINSDPCSFPKHKGQKITDVIRDKGLSPVYSTAMEAAKTVAPVAVCAELVAIKNSFGCAGAFNRMADSMIQKGNPPLTSMPELLNEVLNSKKYDKGLKIAANKIINMAQNPETISTDLFTELKNSFKESGYTDAISEKMTFDTLGMIATAGPALNIRINKLEFAGDRWPTVAALTSIASLAPYLDYHASKKGSLYSFPPGITGQCDTSKSYHFWMAAYLARSEAAAGTSPDSAASAAYSAAKMYHVVGNLTNRGGAGRLLMHDTLSPVANIIRADLSYASAGALFGAGIDTKTPINVDKGISVSISKSEDVWKLSLEEAINEIKPIRFFGYNKFKDKFAPNEIFKTQVYGKKFKPLTKSPVANQTADVRTPNSQCP